MAGQIWTTNSLGGFLSNKMFSEKIRVAAQPIQLFRQHVDAEAELGERKGGDTVLFDKLRNVDTGGGSLTETATIPKTQFSIVQGSVVMTEYGNSVPLTEKLSVLSKINVPQIVEIALMNDMSKTLNSEAWLKFSAVDWKAAVVNTATTSFATTTTVPAAAGASMSDKNFRDIVDELKKADVPRLPDGNYRAIGSTNSVRGLFDFFEAKANQTTLVSARSGLIGRYYGTIVMEETHVLSNTLNSSTHGEAVFFGADAVREKIAVVEEIRIKIPFCLN